MKAETKKKNPKAVSPASKKSRTPAAPKVKTGVRAGLHDSNTPGQT